MAVPSPLRYHRYRQASPAESLTTEVNRAIAHASLGNELKVAYVRATVLAISSALDLLVFLFPQHLLGKGEIAPTIALISVSGFVISVGILRALRHPTAWRWLTPLQTAIPLFDALLLALFITNIWNVLGSTKPDIITNVAALCCLVAVSGGIRIRRQASVLTTLLALINFAYAAALFRLDIIISLFVLFTILATGLLGMLTAAIVRRQGKNEAGRLLMARFLPPTVVEAAFESPIRLLTEPRECTVTIMVTDLRGFTRYAENSEPIAVMEFLSQLQGFLTTVVERHGGWVDKFMGDGMLAVFGVPGSLANHAQQAVSAAQEILENAPQWSSLPIGIGVHSGIVVAGCLGTEGHLEFTVIGDTVNVAARLETLTKETQASLLVSESTQRQITATPLVSLGNVPIRGRGEEIEVFTIASQRITSAQ